MERKASPTQRDAFATRLGVLAATLGSAVGLGNIWKFPYLTGENGGAAFVIVYIVATLFVGLPVMISEHAIGRMTRANATDAFRKLAPKTPWWLVGVAGVLSAFFIMAFYSEVAGWVLAYIAKSGISLFQGSAGALATSDPLATSAVFNELVSDPLWSLIVQWVALIGVGAIIAAGVSKGIERMTKRLLPILFVLLLVVCIRSLTLDGASEGLKFLFKPDFSQLTSSAVLVAMGLAFFKLSVGMGTMITYGSYYPDDANIPHNAIRVMLADVLVSLLAGMAIFPAVFAFGFEPAAGPSLLFITIPAVFSSMPFGSFFMVLFFILSAVAATGAMVSLVEVPVALLHEKLGWSRIVSTVVTVVLLAAIGSTAALSSSTLANFQLFGKNMFDLFDFASSNILLPLGGFFISLFITWRFGFGNKELVATLTNNGTLKNTWLVKTFLAIITVVTPIAVLIILLDGLGLFA